jgi:hypothetical protein
VLTFLWFCEKMPSFPSIRNVNDRIRSLGSGPVEFWLLVGSLPKQALGSGRKVRVVRTFLVAEVTRGIVGLDASATVNAANSIEKMLSHELAATHAVAVSTRSFAELVAQSRVCAATISLAGHIASFGNVPQAGDRCLIQRFPNHSFRRASRVSRPTELHRRPLAGRVGDWRAGLGRSLCSPLTRSFVCECRTISTLPRFQPPPRRTRKAVRLDLNIVSHKTICTQPHSCPADSTAIEQRPTRISPRHVGRRFRGSARAHFRWQPILMDMR